MISTLLTAQLYVTSKKYKLPEQPERILRAIAAAGYTGIETFYTDGESYQPVLAASGLHYDAAHLVPGQLQDLPRLIDHLHIMGGADVCSSGLLDWHQRSPDDYRRAADFLNEQGRQLREAGIFLHYHNHEFEFEALPSAQTGMDILLETLDPQAVTLCLDVGWVWYAGCDPLAVLTQHAERIGYLHLRDFRGRESRPLGQGEMALGPILSMLANLPHLRHTAIEQDPTTDTPLEDLSLSREYLRHNYAI